jgi:NitT/TauT family transport system substrate-binding protein
MGIIKRLVAAAMLTVASASLALAAAPEKTSIELGVGGKPLLYYLPLTLADRLGYFKEQGLDVTINDFGGGAKSLQALIGGSVDVVTGAYEHTIRMQQKGQDIRAVIELGRFPGIVLAIAKSKAASYKSPADLKGMNIGVSAPGSSTNIMVLYLMARAGLGPDDASFIGVGGGASAVAAMEHGELDAISNLDPVIAKLQADDAIEVVVDTRTEEGTREVFGGTNPAAVLYMKEDFIKANPNTVQALTNAFYKTLQWLQKATPEQIADTVPEEYWLGDKDLYLRAVKSSMPTYSITGEIPEEGRKSALNLLTVTDPAFKDAPIDLDRTVDPSFIAKVPKTAP